MFLFGITWLFAILTISVSGLREIFQILFTLFNSFQGLFIFLFFCAINKEARESWKEMFGSGRRSELLHSPYAISNGHSPNGSRRNAFRVQKSATDTSTLKHHDHIMMISKHGENRKESWDSENSGYKPDALQDIKIVATEDSDILLKGIVIEKDEVKPNDEKVDPSPAEKEPKYDLVNPIPVAQDQKHDFDDNFSLTSATTESGIDPSDSGSIGEHDPISKDGSRSLSSVPELDATADQTSSVSANTQRKNSATLKVSIKRYPSRKEREYDVEEMKVEFHSDSSSESSDEDF